MKAIKNILITIFVCLAITTFAQPPNDDICSPTALTLDGTCVTSQTNVNSTNQFSGTGCMTSANTVWYSVTVTGTNNQVNVTFSNTSFGGNIEVSLWDGVCGSPSVYTAPAPVCGNGTTTFAFNPVAAGNYLICLGTSNANEGGFDICATESFVVTPDEDPCSAPLILDSYCSSGTFPHTNTGASTQFANNWFKNNACGDKEQDEVFFVFQATQSGITIQVDNGTMAGGTAQITLWDAAGGCNPNTMSVPPLAFSCPGFGTPITFANDLTVGNFYYVAIDNTGKNNTGTFDLCLTPYVFTPPTTGGFTCGSAINMNTEGIPYIDATTTSGAGNNWRNSCVEGYYGHAFGEGPDKWYQYTTGATPEVVTYELEVTTADHYATVSVLNRCPSSSTEAADALVDNSTSLCYDLGTAPQVAGQVFSRFFTFEVSADIPCTPVYLDASTTYYFVVDNWPTPNSIDYTFTFQSHVPAANNSCTSPTTIGGTTTSTTTSGNNAGCNYSLTGEEPNSEVLCAVTLENVAWFEFTADATTVTMDIANLVGSIQYGIFTGACGGPYTSAGTNAANTTPGGLSTSGDPCFTSTVDHITTFTGLTIGTTYWLAVDGTVGTPSSFDITMTGILLSVDLLYFKGNANDNGNNLHWATSAESHNELFLLQKSRNGSEFESIAEIKGSGSTSDISKYGYLDKEVKAGLNHYRLAMKDAKGKISYSDIVTIDNNESTFEIMNLYVSDDKNLFFTINSPESEVISTKIYDMSGKIIIDKSLQLNKGANQLKVNEVSSLANGQYLLFVTDAIGRRTYKKFSK